MVNSGQLMGPRIFTAGNLINSMPPTGFVETMVQNAGDVTREVRDQANKGVDYVKLYVNLTPNLVRAAIQEAHEQKIKVIGHLFATGWTEAANLGIDALTHGVPESPSLLSNDKARIFLNEGGGPFTHSLWLSLVDLNSNEIKQMIQKLVEKKLE